MTDIRKFSVYDKTIIDSPQNYGIYKGSENITAQSFPCIGPTASKQNYLIQFPSYDVHMPLTNVNWHCDVVLKVTVMVTDIPGAYPAFGAPLIPPGMFSFASFPMHRAVDTVNLLVNGCPFPYQMGLCLDPLLRACDLDSGKYQTCPSMVDNYAFYDDANGTADDPLGGYNNASGAYIANGAYSRWYFCNADGTPVGAGLVNNAARVGMAATRNGMPLSSIDGATILAAPTSLYCYIRLISDEPIMMSPFNFLNNGEESHTGISQISKLEWNVSLKSDVSDMLLSRSSTLATGTIQSVAISSFPANAMAVQCIFKSPNATIGITSPTSVIPYLHFDPQIRESQLSFSAGAGNKQKMQLQSIPLQKCPDGLFIWAQPKSYSNLVNAAPQVQFSPSVAKFRYVIDNLRIGFGQNTAQLQDFTREQLYWLSRANGIDIEYPEYIGVAIADNTPRSLCGSLVYLKCGKDLYLGDESLAPGVQARLLLNVEATVVNQTSLVINNGVPIQLFVVPVYSSYIVSEQGKTVQKDLIIDERDVLENSAVAPGEDIVTDASLRRMVGGGWFDKISSIVRKGMDWFQKGKKVYEATKPHISEIVKVLPDGAVRDTMKSVGYGRRSAAGRKSGGGKQRASEHEDLMNYEYAQAPIRRLMN